MTLGSLELDYYLSLREGKLYIIGIFIYVLTVAVQSSDLLACCKTSYDFPVHVDGCNNTKREMGPNTKLTRHDKHAKETLVSPIYLLKAC